MDWRVAVFPWDDLTKRQELRAAKSRRLVLRLNAPSTLGFSVSGFHEDALMITELVTDAIVSADGVDVCRLRCGPSLDSVGESGHGVTFELADYRQVLKRRRLNTTDTLFYPSGTDEATIVWGLISAVQSRTRGNYGITQGVGFPTGDTRQATFQAGQFVGNEIQAMADLETGFEWDINSALQVNLYDPQRGVDNDVSLEYGKSVSAFTRSKTATKFADDIMVTGDSNTTPVVSISAGIATAVEGRWDGVESFPSISDQTTLNDRAPYSLAQRSVASATYNVKIAPGYWKGLAHIGLGDTVLWRAKTGRIDEIFDMRVLEIGVGIGDDGEEDVSMSLGEL